jgi:glutathione S-transferase
MATTENKPIKLYRHALSGHSHRVELFLSILGVPYELVDVDLKAGAHKKPEFLARNPFGQVPVIEDGAVVVFDSNGILVYLANKYDAGGQWLPRDAATAASVQGWLSVAAGQVAFGPAAARLVTVFGAPYEPEELKKRSAALLQVLDKHLADRKYLAGDAPTIADVANYAYLAHAPEGNIDIAPFANVTAWLARIERLPGFIPMQRTAVGLAA